MGCGGRCGGGYRQSAMRRFVAPQSLRRTVTKRGVVVPKAVALPSDRKADVVTNPAASEAIDPSTGIKEAVIKTGSDSTKLETEVSAKKVLDVEKEGA